MTTKMYIVEEIDRLLEYDVVLFATKDRAKAEKWAEEAEKPSIEQELGSLYMVREVDYKLPEDDFLIPFCFGIDEASRQVIEVNIAYGMPEYCGEGFGGERIITINAETYAEALEILEHKLTEL